MTPVTFILILSLVLFFGVAATVLVWAARAGQFSNPRAGSESIFDSGEPIGKTTDGFPPDTRPGLEKNAAPPMKGFRAK